MAWGVMRNGRRLVLNSEMETDDGMGITDEIESRWRLWKCLDADQRSVVAASM